MKSVRERIRQAMERSGTTQEQVAKACNVTPPAVNQWLSGRIKNVNPAYLPGVAASTNTSLDWLMTGKGTPQRSGTDPLDAAERKLIAAYRKLSPALRTQFADLVSTVSAQES